MNWELIGKLGGVEVQKIPVDIVADGGQDSEVIMHTVNVPPGETWLVALIGDLDPGYTTSSGPRLFIGEESIGPRLHEGRNSLVVEVTGTAEVSLSRNTGARQDDFSGHIYTAPLPA